MTSFRRVALAILAALAMVVVVAGSPAAANGDSPTTISCELVQGENWLTPPRFGQGNSANLRGLICEVNDADGLDHVLVEATVAGHPSTEPDGVTTMVIDEAYPAGATSTTVEPFQAYDQNRDGGMPWRIVTVTDSLGNETTFLVHGFGSGKVR